MFTEQLHILRVHHQNRNMTIKNTALFPSFPFSSLFFCLFICPCFWIHPIIFYHALSCLCVPNRLRELRELELQKACKKKKKTLSNNAEFSSSTPKTQEERDTLHHRNEKLLHNVVSGFFYTVYSVSLDSSFCHHLLAFMLFPICVLLFF